MSARAARTARLLTLAKVAEAFEADPRTVRRWRAAGLPVAQKGKRGHAEPLFDVVVVEKWLEEQGKADREMVLAISEKLDARARRVARQVAEHEAEHVDRDRALAEWGELLDETLPALKAIPASWAAHLVAVAGQAEQPPAPPTDRRVLGAEDLRALLAGPPETWPFPPGAEGPLRRIVEAGGSITLRVDGAWFPGAQPVLRANLAPAARVALELGELVHTWLSARSAAPPAGAVVVRPRPVTASSTIRAGRSQLAAIETELLNAKERAAAGGLVPVVAVRHAAFERAAGLRMAMQGWAPALSERLAPLEVEAVRRELEAALQPVLEDLRRPLLPPVAAEAEGPRRGKTTARQAPRRKKR